MSTNGLTVWVNGKRGCIARFCRFSQEHFLNNGSTQTTRHEDPSKLNDYWEIFKIEVDKRYKLDLSDCPPFSLINPPDISKKDLK
jgi:hypothetical protein